MPHLCAIDDCDQDLDLSRDWASVNCPSEHGMCSGCALTALVTSTQAARPCPACGESFTVITRTHFRAAFRRSSKRDAGGGEGDVTVDVTRQKVQPLNAPGINEAVRTETEPPH